MFEYFKTLFSNIYQTDKLDIDKFIEEYNRGKTIYYKLPGTILISKDTGKKYEIKNKLFDNPGMYSKYYDREYYIDNTIIYFDSFLYLLKSGEYDVYNFNYTIK